MNVINRESSKKKVDRIQRLRVEIEHVREENNFLLKNLDKYDNWLFESIDEINNLFDKNISDNSWDYEEDSIEYDFDPKDYNFGEKRKAKKHFQKNPKKLVKEINQCESISTCNNSNEQTSSIKLNSVNIRKEKTSNSQIPKDIQKNSKVDLEKKARTTSTKISSQKPAPVVPANSSPLEILYKFNPQLAAQILRPFIEKYKTQLNMNKSQKETIDNNAQGQMKFDHKNSVLSTNELKISSETNHAQSESSLQENNSKNEEPFDDL